MRLKRLWIDGFKNLNDFELDFSDKEGITVLIGNNGSGKSNVLEAISAIFADLYNIDNVRRRKKVDFNYKIEYEIENKNVVINVVSENEEVDYYAKLDDKQYDDLKQSPLKEFLPTNILMIYSGEDLSIQKRYYESFIKNFQAQIRGAQVIPSLPKMLYINSFFWTISLLSLLKSDNPKDEEFCKTILKNDTLKNIEILFSFNSHLITQELFSLAALYDGNEERVLFLNDFKSIEHLPNEKDLFVQLTGMVGQRNKIKKLTIINNGVDTQFLSEGEKKQILIRSALSFLADENSLILFDEPDANIHVANKVQIELMLKDSNRENILTTHSPTLTHAFDEKHNVMLKDGKPENSEKQEMFSHITDGIWNYQEQNIFLTSSKDIILLVEGKHDKIHILEAFKRLKDDYESLDFDIFDMNGESNIKHMILGLANNNVDFNGKKIIAIFDNDKPGEKSFSENFRKIEDKQFKCLVDNSGNQSTIFYGFLLPKTNGFSSNFTIENMYDGTKFKEALATAFENRNRDNNFFNNFIDDVSKQIKEDAKNILANNCKDFDNNDFEHFRNLFDLIKEIKDLR